jgi:hypothetical protein
MLPGAALWDYLRQASDVEREHKMAIDFQKLKGDLTGQPLVGFADLAENKSAPKLTSSKRGKHDPSESKLTTSKRGQKRTAVTKLSAAKRGVKLSTSKRGPKSSRT